jgi:acyl-CoA reductase-like NAD-dependent aldehyde dehydrogenase
VPLYYEILACQEAGYTYFDSWKRLSAEERAIHIAHLMAKNLVAQHQEDAIAREMDKRNKKKAKG